MSLRDSRLTRALCSSVAPAFAGMFFLACTGAPGEGTETTNQALTRGDGMFGSQVTKESWNRHVGENHGRWDDERRCHPQPLALCPLFDSGFLGVDGGPACANVTTPACPDRVDTWDFAIVLDFALAVTADCRFGQWAPPLLTNADVANYLNDLLAFTLQFFGCPAEGTTGKLTFGLIPSALQGHKFTTADLDALSDAYSAAVVQALSDFGAPPLTADQARDIDAKLSRLSRRVPEQVRSHRFTFSTCPAGTVTPDADSTRDDDDGDVDCH
jgi:hypothetical protein